MEGRKECEGRKTWKKNDYRNVWERGKIVGQREKGCTGVQNEGKGDEGGIQVHRCNK
jgi:hypothetical protein